MSEEAIGLKNLSNRLLKKNSVKITKLYNWYDYSPFIS